MRKLTWGTQIETWRRRSRKAFLIDNQLMLPLELKIDRVQKLVRMLEQDAPLLAVRVAPLSRERQQSVKSYAQDLTAHARAELQRLMDEKAFAESGEPSAHAAD